MTDLRQLAPYVIASPTRAIVIVVAAAASLVATVGIPILTKAVIDGPARDHDQRGLWVLGVAAMALAASEAAMLFLRRWLTAHATMGVGADIRRDLRARIWILPLALHQRSRPAQLVSRIMNDLSAIRDLLSFGAAFMLLNILQITVVTVCLMVTYWPLGLVVLGSIVPILASVLHASAPDHDSSRRNGLVKAQFWTMLEIIPDLALVVLLGCAAFTLGNQLVTIGTLAAFLLMTLSLIWPVTAMGFLLSMTGEAMTAARRIAEPCDIDDGPAGHPEDDYLPYAATGFVTPLADL